MTTRTTRRGSSLVDQTPELFPYKDDGCELSPSCLNCQMPRCKYDDPGWMQRERRIKRDQAVIEARQREGLTIPQLTRRFRVSERTVFRILRQAIGSEVVDGELNRTAQARRGDAPNTTAGAA